MEINEKLSRLLVLLEKHSTKEQFVEYLSPEDLRKIVSLDGKKSRQNWDEIFSWIEIYVKYCVKTGHPDFVNRMWTNANLPSILGEIVTAVTNTSACTFESAPVSTVIEQYMLAKMLDVVGFKDGEGQMTTGSSNANMISMLAARNTYAKQVKRKGLFEQKPMFAFVSEDAHYSLDKAANTIGIGADNLVKVALDSSGRMDSRALEQSIEEVTALGGMPFYVCATAGTTVRGAFDPIKDILELKDTYSFWLHVDGAWGGAVIFSNELKKRYLPSIEKVDSFTWDFHKMLGTNLICNILLCNSRPGILSSTCSAGDDSYIFRSGDQLVNDLGSISLQCGRKVDSLKWFLDWKYYGNEGFAQRVESFYELCCYAEQVVTDTEELEMLVPRESFNICFRFITGDGIDVNTFNKALRTRLYENSILLVGYGYIEDKLALRLLITHASYTRRDVDNFFIKVVDTAKVMLKELENGSTR